MRPDRYSGIAADLRGIIARGELPPGGKLPGRRELASRFGTTVDTVQKAIHLLQDNGFVESRGWQGSFVSTHPPHLFHFGLLLPASPDRLQRWTWSTFLDLLAEAAAHAESWAPRRISTYANVWSIDNCPEAKRLMADLDAGCLAGLIVDLAIPEANPIRDRIHRGEVPSVTLGSIPGLEHLPKIHFDQQEMRKASLKELAKLGCKRIAVVIYQRIDPREVELLRNEIEEAGLLLSPGCIQGFDPQAGSYWTENWIKQLMAMAPEHRPDGIFVQDEAFLAGVISGLEASGQIPGRDIQVVSHGNFPSRTKVPLGVRRVGWNVPMGIKAAVDVLERQRHGRLVSLDHRQPLIIEH
jgi:DNA-binding transcriptional regulator YhcF (GntR family)